MLSRRPFQPIKLTLSTGRTFDIRRPENAFLTRACILVGIDIAEDDVPDEFKIVSLPDVISIDPLNNHAA